MNRMINIECPKRVIVQFTEPETTLRLGNMPVYLSHLRVRKLLFKSPLADESVHAMKISIYCYDKHTDMTQEQGKPYFFCVFFAGCEKGYVAYQNVEDWDWRSAGGHRSDTDLVMTITIDDEKLEFTEPVYLELEYF